MRNDDLIHNEELPIGFTMELAQHSDALIRFSNLSREQQRSIVDGARQMQSREEMRSYVTNLLDPEVKEHENNRFF